MERITKFVPCYALCVMRFMKTTPKQYARTLYDIVQDKNEQEISNTIKKFVQVLINNNDTVKIKKIIDNFNDIHDINNGIVQAEIVSARKLDKDIVKLLNDYIIKLLDVKEVNVKEEFDINIIGGFIIKYKDKILDGSLCGRIKEIRRII